MRSLLLISLLLLPPGCFAKGDEGVPVPPDTPDSPPPPPPPAPPKPGKTPPDCVNKALLAIYEGEKDHYTAKKSYSSSLLEIRALSKIGLGCPGWALPVLELTYGGSGFTASMRNSEKNETWLINQDRTISLDAPPPAPPPAAVK